MFLNRALNAACFGLVHGNSLIYNQCWEDPRLDRQAMQIGHDDTIMVITSAGCNTLDYALDEPRHIHAVDVNPRQNALLELKLAGIRNLEFDQFFDLFGRGRIANHRDVYAARLRRELSPLARQFWDRRINFFSGEGRGRTFYFHGTTGLFARVINFHVDHVARIRDTVNGMLEATSIEEQAALYESIREAFWNRFIRWMMGRNATLSLLGVPSSQRVQVERYFGGMAQFCESCVEFVFACLPLSDNYFWRVYLRGEYSPTCCPEYLKEENFNRLKDGLIDRISVHTTTIEDFLVNNDVRISRYVLLDHMDWMSAYRRDKLASEWQAIVNRAADDTRILWRSGALQVDYVDPLQVEIRGKRVRVGDVLKYQTEQAAELHQKDRVHTYGSFYIADLATA